MSRIRANRVLLACSAALMVLVSGSPAVAQNAPSPGFYEPPSPLAASSPGEIIRTEPSPLLLEIPSPDGLIPAEATRFMYQSTDTHGAPVAVTGTYLDPAAPWPGPGPRPLISMAPGTQGQGDQCAPSKLLSQLIHFDYPLDLRGEYELPFMTAMLAQGIAVVMTDYQGLGTPGHHTYVNRKAQGHAVLDAVRAAQRLPGTKISSGGPVALWGYSQGGGASASAAELHASYAPELDIKGAYVGAPPADLAEVLQVVDGTILTGVIGYAINGFSQAYPEIRPIVDNEVNEVGRSVLNEVAGQCVAETALRFGFQQTRDYTRSGEPLSVILDRYEEVRAILADQRLGSIAPTVPVLIQSGTADDIVPAHQVRQLAREWCSQDATVELSPNELPPIIPGLAVNHAVPYLAGIGESIEFINARFADRPVRSTC
ncbi:alpha/beta fold hydrolase [Hoyosella altamirensis]|nr:alpha/beta fold hydrolase [Hoyosella altamirensis]